MLTDAVKGEGGPKCPIHADVIFAWPLITFLWKRYNLEINIVKWVKFGEQMKQNIYFCANFLLNNYISKLSK